MARSNGAVKTPTERSSEFELKVEGFRHEESGQLEETINSKLAKVAKSTEEHSRLLHLAMLAPIEFALRLR